MLGMARGEGMGGHFMSRIAGVLAVAAGGLIAWVDTRPTWDDTGMTAGALLITAGLAALVGLRWWLAAILVVCPLLLAEVRSAGLAVVLAPGFAVVGGIGGSLLRRVGAHPQG